MTRIVCHRGASRHAPENTIAAGRMAARLGGDMVGCDLRQSRDRVLYLLHDATLERTTDGHGEIAQIGSAVLDTLDAGRWFAPEYEGEPLPRLDAFLDALAPEIDFHVRIRAADPDAVAGALLAAGVAERSIAHAPDPSRRAALRRAAPWLRQVVNWRELDNLQDINGPCGAQIVEFHAADLTTERLEQVRAHGALVMLHTPLRDEAVLRWALSLRVDYLNVDYPQLACHLRKVLQENC